MSNEMDLPIFRELVGSESRGVNASDRSLRASRDMPSKRLANS